MRCFGFIGTLAAVAGAACAAAPAAPKSSQHALLAKPLPRFPSVTLQGAPLRPAAFEGRVVVVKFFAKYCEPCRHTLPELATLARERGDIAVIGVSEDAARADAESTIRNYGLPFAVVHDAEHWIAGRFRVTELPATFIADETGTIRWFGGPDQRVGAAPEAARALAEGPR